MFIVYCSLLAGIAIWRGIMPLKLSWKINTVLGFAVFILAFNFIIRKIWNLENLPVPLLLLAGWSFGVLILFDGFLLIFDVINLILRKISCCRKNKVFQWMQKRICRIMLLVLAMVFTAIGMFSALSVPQVKAREIYLTGLPVEFDGMTIAHLSDIHADGIIDADGKKISAIVEKTNSLKPDLIVITGDIVDRRQEMAGEQLRILGKLRARYGVIGVPGNHEYYSGYRKWVDFFNSVGVVMLENEHVLIAGGNMVIGGTTDWTAWRIGMTGPDLSKTFAGAPEGKIRILLAHRPKVAALAAEHNIALQLSGHTHGGMILGIDLIISAFNNFMVSGEYSRYGMKIFVSNGTGIWSGFPIRLGRPAEIALLRLRSEK